jgi:hypothetical protein
MNASKRIEEFILKLSIRQNDHGLFDKVNEIKRKIEDIQISKDNSYSKNCNKS